jgi:glycosyltransferase involved in cell wall biosynthesis
MRSAFLRTTPLQERPWWWEELHLARHACDMDYIPQAFRGKRSKEIASRELPIYLFTLLKDLLRLRRRYDYVYTGECDLTGLGIAFWQSLLFMKRPRHVILEFIMREKTPSLASRLKYALMSFMFRSVHRVVCSSRSEVDYYREAFGWDAGKAAYVPLFTSPTCLEDGDASADENYVVAAGRVFRDYRTVVEAVRGTPFKLIIVGGAGVRREFAEDGQVQVLEEIPNEEFMAVVRRAAAVVVPLMDRRISAGQTVVLQAMAMGKLVIATNTAGTEDYIDHMVDGVLVRPGDVEELRRAIGAAASRELRERLGSAARERVASGHMPHHYSAAVRRAVLRPAAPARRSPTGEGGSELAQ